MDLDPELMKDLVEYLEKELDGLLESGNSDKVMFMLSKMDSDVQKRLFKGRKVRIAHAIFGRPYNNFSHSGAYEWRRALSLCTEAHKLKLLDIDKGYRDVKTGKRMKTKLRELGRLQWEWEWDSEEGRAWLLRNWDILCEDDISVIKDLVRQHNSRRRSRD